MGIAQVYEEGRLIRGEWSDTDDAGRPLLCLYTALVGDSDSRPAECPARVAPRWLAYLLPFIDDSGSESTWDATVRRVAALAPSFGKLSSECEWRVRRRLINIALERLRARGEAGLWITHAELAKDACRPDRTLESSVAYRRAQIVANGTHPLLVSACGDLAFGGENGSTLKNAAFDIGGDDLCTADKIIAAILDEIETDLAAH